MSVANDQVRVDDLEDLLKELESQSPSPGDPCGGGGINLGALHQLVVPAEDLGLDAGGEDLDFSAQMIPNMGRPDSQRWFALIKGYWMSTRLLPVASKTSEFGVDWYCVLDPAARSLVRNYMRDVMILPCYLVHTRVWTIWIIPVNATKSYTGVEPLFRLSTEFYTENVFRVLSERSHGCYRVKSELISEIVPPIAMPAIQTRTVGE